MQLPHCPQEILDHIIDILADDEDQKKLFSYSLVSRSWITRARHHLLLNFVYNPTNKRSLTRYAELVALCTHPNNTIFSVGLKGDVTLWMNIPSLRMMNQSKQRSMVEVLFGKTTTLQLGLMAVEELRIALYLGGFASVTTLTLTAMKFHSPTRFLDVLTGFPRLTSLTLLRIRFELNDESSIPSTALSNLATLRLLELPNDDDTVSSLAALLKAFEGCMTLRRLDACIRLLGEMAHLNTFLRVQGSRLSSCLLDFSSLQLPDDPEVSFDMLTSQDGPRFTIRGHLKDLLILFAKARASSPHPEGQSRLKSIVLHTHKQVGQFEPHIAAFDLSQLDELVGNWPVLSSLVEIQYLLHAGSLRTPRDPVLCDRLERIVAFTFRRNLIECNKKELFVVQARPRNDDEDLISQCVLADFLRRLEIEK
ncbi:hypothetical protein VNI00_004541 [Paramarasmius palmivorus]|uniref:F-box domain-containing protein n=1 Tax=Paramarasmius palmivorus TaxID=297713 RepID=A0AAW0DI18_9AGAR